MRTTVRETLRALSETIQKISAMEMDDSVEVYMVGPVLYVNLCRPIVNVLEVAAGGLVRSNVVSFTYTDEDNNVTDRVAVIEDATTFHGPFDVRYLAFDLDKGKPRYFYSSRMKSVKMYRFLND